MSGINMKVVRNISFELEAFVIERGRIVFKWCLYEVHCKIYIEKLAKQSKTTWFALIFFFHFISRVWSNTEIKNKFKSRKTVIEPNVQLI